MVYAAGILVIDNEGRLLVLHRKDFIPEGNHWGLPGGKVSDKSNPVKSAILKTFQEVGLMYKETDLTYLDEFRFTAEGNDITYAAWLAKYNKDEKIDLNLDGHDAFKWDKPEKLLELDDLMIGMYPILRKYLTTIKLGKT